MRVGIGAALPSGTRRYSRLATCATSARYALPLSLPASPDRSLRQRHDDRDPFSTRVRSDVAQSWTLPYRGSGIRRRWDRHAARPCQRPADHRSATQQVGNLRYRCSSSLAQAPVCGAGCNCSAGCQSAAAGTFQRAGAANALPTTGRRHGRLATCATAAVRLWRKPPSAVPAAIVAPAASLRRPHPPVRLSPGKDEGKRHTRLPVLRHLTRRARHFRSHPAQRRHLTSCCMERT